eukprot:5572587-Amphidinium_carterae.1
MTCQHTHIKRKKLSNIDYVFGKMNIFVLAHATSFRFATVKKISLTCTARCSSSMQAIAKSMSFAKPALEDKHIALVTRQQAGMRMLTPFQTRSPMAERSSLCSWHCRTLWTTMIQLLTMPLNLARDEAQK